MGPTTSPSPSKKIESAVEAWLRYFDDLGVRSFYLDRAGTVLLRNDDESGTSPLSREEISLLPKITGTVDPDAPAEPLRCEPPSTGLVGLFDPSPILRAAEGIRETLEVISSDLGECTRCKLHRKRNKIVFGVGNPHADLVFVGEGPGHDEDMQGLPFVGRAGKLLTQMIEAMGLSRADVYIANVVKCRPPENRQPQEDEVETCMPFLLRQLAAIEPKVIVCLGSTAAQALLKTKRSISHFRGQWFDFQGAKLLPTYHPAYLLRNPNAKPDVWNDLKKVLAALGLEPPKRQSSRSVS